MILNTSSLQQKLFLWSGIVGTFGLLTIVAVLIWHSNRTPPEPINIYKSFPIRDMNTKRSTSERAKVGIQSLPGEGKRPRKAHTHDARTHVHIATSELQETTSSEPENVGSSVGTLTPKELDTLEHQSWHEKSEKEMEALTAALNAKYPDLVEIASISLEEIRGRYPTMDALKVLGERIKAMQSEFETRIDTLVAEMPLHHQIQFITMVGDVAAQNWGDEIANQLVGELIANIE